MTEPEWLACDNSTEMLRSLPSDVCDRKLRLFACHCCRSLWHLLLDNRSRVAVEVTERWADGFATEAELEVAEFGSDQVKEELRHENELVKSVARAVSLLPTVNSFGLERCIVVVGDCRMVAYRQSFESESPESYETNFCDLVRDTFGNPFRPVTFSADWRTSDAVALAQTMYEARDFSAMPILADALQDAGCDNEDILAHCRDADQVHVRGCWVVDLVLGKS
jgi:hypothetical protein